MNDLGTNHLISRGGGGLGFFLATSYFFLSFCTTVIFFKSKLQQVFFIFLKNNTLKSEKNVNESNTLNEKVQKP